MKNREVYEFIDSFAPFCTQLDFDNAGFLVGDINAESERCVVTLDVTNEAVEFAKEKGATLIISHHPIIFNPVTSVLKGTVLYEAVRNNMSVISAHTNFDIAPGGVIDCLCKTLKLEKVHGILPEGKESYGARMGELSEALTPEEFANYLKSVLKGGIKFSGAGKKIKTVAVVSGAGSSMLGDILKYSPDAYVTADVKHDAYLKAYENGVSIYDCGHFETEDVAVAPLASALKEKFKDTEFIEYHESHIKTV